MSKNNLETLRTQKIQVQSLRERKWTTSLNESLIKEMRPLYRPHDPLTKKAEGLPCSSGAQSIIYNLVGDNTD